MKASFKIFRYNPETDESPGYKIYELDAKRGMTVLDALNEIKYRQDGTLTYRSSCRSAICGSCAVRVNGYEKLICKTQVVDIVERYNRKELLIEPLKNLEIIKDLVVDRTSFWNKIARIEPWLITEEQTDFKKPHKMLPEQVAVLEKTVDCIMCGICDSACDVTEIDEKFLGPAALTKAYRFIEDSRDTHKMKRLRAAADNGLWRCAHSHACIERCPKKVIPCRSVYYLRTVALEQKAKFDAGTRHANTFVYSIKKTGKVAEALLLVMTRLFSAISTLPLGIKLAVRGKFPVVFPKRVKDYDSVQKIFKALEG